MRPRAAEPAKALLLQLIATQGPALALMGPLRFEASVASAIPIVETLAETLAADRIRYVSGILNGTTNSMLDAMAAGASYADALADAQQRGLAEADPIADVDAHDPARTVDERATGVA